MSARLFFVEQKDIGVEQHRWLMFNTDGTFEFSEFYANKAKMVSDCVDRFKTDLTDEKKFIFEDMSPGMANLITNAALNRYNKEFNYFDECINDDHEPGCTCEGLRALEEVLAL